MLPKSEHHAYIGYNDGSKAIKYYNAATRNILTSHNYKFLQIDQLPTPEEIVINPPNQGESTDESSSREGEDKEGHAKSPTIPCKRTVEETCGMVGLFACPSSSSPSCEEDSRALPFHINALLRRCMETKKNQRVPRKNVHRNVKPGEIDQIIAT
jgi:hypothetical protein